MDASLQLPADHRPKRRQGRATWQPWLGVLRLALCALAATAHPTVAAQPDTLAGTAVVMSVSWPDVGDGPERLLAVRTDNGRHVLVETADATATATEQLVTGARVQVAGEWRRRSPGPASASSSQGLYMKASRLQVTAPPQGHSAGHGRDSSRSSTSGTAARRGRWLRQAATAGTANTGAPAPAQGGAGPGGSVTVTPSANPLVASEVSTLFIPIAAIESPGVSCPNTAPPLSSVAAVKKAAFEELNPGGVTIGSTFNRCSYNTSRLTMANSLVAPLVQLPCNGTTDGVAWTFQTCNFNDFNGYANAADVVLQKRGIDIDAYQHRVYLLPPSACAFVGLGYVGCDSSDCRVWIGADFWTSPSAIAHELGHNLFLAHAGAITNTGEFDEYADNTCTMGYCCSNRCPNTPHAWQLGWITAQQLDWATVQPGQTVALTLNSQSLSSQSGLRITRLNGSDPVFVGYRTLAGGDASATSDVAGDPGGPSRLHIYTAPINNTFDSRFTTWLTSLDTPKQSWALPGTRLVVRLQGANGSAAVVTLCRKVGPETPASCQAGLDNDCNGKTGAEDAACLQYGGEASGLSVKTVQPPPPQPQPAMPTKLVQRQPPPKLQTAQKPPPRAQLPRPPPPRKPPPRKLQSVRKPPPRRPPPRRPPPTNPPQHRPPPRRPPPSPLQRRSIH